MSETPEPPDKAPEDPEVSEFLQEEPAFPEIPAALEAPPRASAGVWPLYAAAALVLATLWAVWVLLRPGPRAGEPSADGAPATVTVPGVALTSERSASAKPIETLSEGARVKAFADDGAWANVEADSGKRGFLPADAIERDADRDARNRRAQTILAFPPVFGVTGEDCDVRLAPYPLAAKGGRLTKGSVIEIHSVDHSYFAFRDKTWGIAFVASAMVDIVPPDPKQPAITPEKIRPLKDVAVVELEGEPPPEEEPPTETGETPRASAPPPAGAPEASPIPGLVEPPVLVSRVEPTYPELARRAGLEGTVELEISIDASGKVAEVEVVRGLPLGLSQAAADAVKRWVYRPARASSGPVPARKTIRVQFQLQSERH
jgi:protein TonB